MKSLDISQFNKLLTATPIKTKLKSELRFIKSIERLSQSDWDDSELLPITDRTGSRGVLLLAPDNELFIVPYEISQGITNTNGQAQPIICDFCRTWQSGTRSGSISFALDKHSSNRRGFLCCADLRCSSHVRNKTASAHTSRAHLREDLTNEQRVERFKERLRTIIETLELTPVPLPR